ncbi:uncharacterized protein LOC133313570 [Gastrolobium bilobum]|uniref:uncharacterized protein LOC133313570 n=1 Tax=Gastrolobium bilobum TaxID=150636 RepID=UPI002AB31125|nr:uncharacterized protein LOC133313570 [Gastrolobium bilobum]
MTHVIRVHSSINVTKYRALDREGTPAGPQTSENNVKINYVKHAPGPKALPIIGNLHMLGKLPHRNLQSLALKYGPIMSLKLGHVPAIVVSSSETAELFLKTHDTVFVGRPKLQATESLVHASKGFAFCDYGAYWRNVRKVCIIQLLSASKVEMFAPLRREQLGLFVKSLENAAASREVVDLSELVGELIENIVYKMLLGYSKDDRFNLKDLVAEVVNLIGAFNLADYVPWLGVFDLQGLKRRLNKASKAFDQALELIIKEKEHSSHDKEKEPHKKDFVDILLSLMHQPMDPLDEQKVIDRTSIKAIISDIIEASFESSSSVVVWAMSELLRHPRVMNRLQDELENVVGMNRQVEETDLEKLPYLNMVVKETLRLYPLVPLLLPRESREDVIIDGYYIKKKTRIIINAWAIGRDPKIWSHNADVFYPERFVNNSVDIKGNDFRLIPFGSGRRGCPGIRLGLITSEIVLAQLVHCFNWKLPLGMSRHDIDMTERFGLTIPRSKHLLAMPIYRLVDYVKHAPGPKALPIIGNLHMLGKLPHRNLQSLALKYGPIMSLKLGQVPAIVVSSTETAELFLKTHDTVFASRPKLQAAESIAHASKGLAFCEYGAFWRNVRKVCIIQLLSASRVEMFAPLRREQLGLLVKVLENAAASREVVDLSELVGELIENIVYKMLLGYSKDDRFNLKDIIAEVLNLIGAFNLADYVPWLGVFDLQGLKRRYNKASKAVDQALELIIKEKEHLSHDKQKDPHRKDFMDIMLSLMHQPMDPQDEQKVIDRTSIKAIILDIIEAGLESSSSVVVWAMSELLRHPRVMQRLQDELANVVGMNRQVEETDLEKLPYLKMVVKETLRLYPIGPLLLPRESREDVIIDGYYIKKKTRIIINAWAIGRDPKVWSHNADVFYPERFVNNSVDFKGNDFRLIPFGSGRRRCPGIHLGLITSEIVLAQLVHCFNWELPLGMSPHDLDMTERFGLSMPRNQHLLVVPTYRLVGEVKKESN